MYSLLEDARDSRRNSAIARVSHHHLWRPHDIAQVRGTLENEAVVDSGVTTEGEAVAPTAVSNGQVDVQDQVSSFIYHGQELQDADGTRGQHASEPIVEGSATRRKRKQGGLEDSRKRARLHADLEDVDEDLSSQDGEVMSEKGPEQDMDTD